jgi:hypothetical protein
VGAAGSAHSPRCRALGYGADEPVSVSYSGGAFGVASVLDAFERRLRTLPGDIQLRHPLLPPVIGAALYAAGLGGSPLGQDALTALMRTEAL